jgi:hypothetical protein
MPEFVAKMLALAFKLSCFPLSDKFTAQLAEYGLSLQKLAAG